MSSICRPVHCVDLGKMAFEGALRLHSQPRKLLDALPGDITDCGIELAHQMATMASGSTERGDLRVVSASSSFLRFILSLSASASRLAICIFC